MSWKKEKREHPWASTSTAKRIASDHAKQSSWKIPAKQWREYRFHGEGKPKHNLDIKWFGQTIAETQLVGAYNLYHDIKGWKRRKR